MSAKPYGLFCPISKACEVVEPRWTLQILTEMWNGSTRFNEIHRGIPRISPSLLSKRLKEMEQAGLIERLCDPVTGAVEYLRTERAIDLEPIMTALGNWAQRHVEPDTALSDQDARVLMWFVRRKIDTAELPQRRVVIRFHFADAPKGENTFWLIAKPGVAVDLCLADPGFDVDVFVETEVPVLTGALLGRLSLRTEIDSGRITLSGAPRLSRSIYRWLTVSSFAEVSGIARASEPRFAVQYFG